MTKATPNTISAKTFAVTGTINPGIFAFYQATAAEVDALFAAQDGGAPVFRKLTPVLQQRNCGYLGTISNFMDEKAYAKAVKDGKKSPHNPNPGSRDGAWLDLDKNTLVVSGTIKMVPNFFAPTISDSPEFSDWQRQFVTQYLNSGQFPGLIRRYLDNLVNAKVLWRNQYGFERKAVVTVKTLKLTKSFYLVGQDDPTFDALVDAVATELTNPKGFLSLDVALCVELGAGAEVFPSQPFLDDKKSVRSEHYGRVLSAVELDKGRHQVIFHPQKIGNALRQIDVWHSAAADLGPIAIEAYGVVTSQRKVCRPGSESFFKLVGQEYEALSEGDRHYLMGMLIKGGLLGQSE